MNPADWIIAIEGTPAGREAATVLALVSALAHAAFGAIQKGRYDPWIMRGAIDIWFAVMALPIALFVLPLPGPGLWLMLAGVMVIHTVYKLLMAMAYERGAYTAVYPIVRGTGPVATVIVAGAVFGEHFTPAQWGGVLLLSGAIFGIAALNIRGAPIGRVTLFHASALAVLAGLMVAVYSVYDALGIRIAGNPFTFLAWFFVLEAAIFPILAFRRWRAMPLRQAPVPLLMRGMAGGMLGFLSFGCVMLATRLDKVGEAIALRETSVVFAALIGWLCLREQIGPVRTILMLLVALGAVTVEFG